MTAARPGWDDYFLGIAEAVARRADCTRRQVGAVIAWDRRIVACGYNGAPAGHPGCLDGNCPRGQSGVPPGSSYDTGPGACIAVHAEMNCFLYADYDKCRGATLYVTHTPCDGCRKHAMAAGIARIVTREPPERENEDMSRPSGPDGRNS